MADPTQTRPQTEEVAPDAPDTIPDIIRAHSFELIDQESNPRAQFGFGDDSGDIAQIVFLDPSGKTRVGVTCGRDGAGIGFIGGNGLRMSLVSAYTDDGGEGLVALDLNDAEGKTQFMVTVNETGTVTMGGWAGWANERLQNADVASDGLKLLASEVSGFMRPGDRVVDPDEQDDDMRKLSDYMHKKGREERAAFMQECSEKASIDRLTAVEAQAERITRKLDDALYGLGLAGGVIRRAVDVD